MTPPATAAERPTARLLADYHRWHRLQVATGDIDPTYPVYRHLMAGLDPDQRAWLALLHVAYYHMGSALRAFCAHPRPAPPTDALLHLPCATERRAHRDPRQLANHWYGLLSACETHGGPAAWLTAGGTGWGALTAHLRTVHGNGRWAAYKLGEIAQKVLDVPTVITDAGHAHSSGPRKGLTLLSGPLLDGNTPTTVAHLDWLTDRLAVALGEPDIGLVETSLCDFHSLAKGNYYLGHDIDAMQDQLYQVRSDLTGAAFRARAATLPLAYLGEVGGWTAVDRDRKRTYARTGRIVERQPSPRVPGG